MNTPITRQVLRAVAVALVLATIAAPAAARPPRAQERWVSLFNGKNLDGWVVKIAGHDAGDNYNDTFRVENGVLKVSYDRYKSFGDNFGHLYTKRKYSNYRLRIEYRFVGEQCPGGPTWGRLNSGVMVHSQSAESMRKDQFFPVSVEVQFLAAGAGEERSNANMCSPGTNVVMNGKLVTEHCVNSGSKSNRAGEWVTVEVEVRGNSLVKHFVNGVAVMEYTQPQYDETDPDGKAFIKGGHKMLREGHLALQAESHPIEFRKVEIMELDRNGR
jgi:hypothetical protein